MKKSLLLLGAALSLGIAASASEPVIYESASFQGISPNGRWAVSEVYGVLTIYDFQENKTYTYGEDTSEFSSGNGNNVSNNGIVLGSTTNPCDAAYWENGEWKQLGVPDVSGANHLTHGITPDGSRICGIVGTAPMSTSDNIMAVPAYWDRNDDGTYSDYHLLPHPDVDFIGRCPQYITALSISDDGRTIAGQITDYSGYNQELIVYTQDDNGEWSYNLPLRHLYNPEGLELLENPGDSPIYPAYEDFMSDEEYEAYAAALAAWQPGVSTYPSYKDYMTEEELAAFEAAVEDWQLLYDQWNELYSNYMAVINQILDASPAFEFNNCYLSADGKTVASTVSYTVDDPSSWWPVVVYNVWAVDITSGEVTKYEDVELMASNICNNGVILASTGLDSEEINAYVLKDGKTQTLREYIGELSPEYGKWMDEHMSHEVEMYDWETGEFIFSEIFSSGIPVATPDMSVILTWTMSDWSDTYYCEGYYFDMSEFSGIKEVATPVSTIVKVDANGNIILGTDVVAVEVYSISGMRVLSAANTVGMVENNLGKGVYIVKATLSDGTVATAKLAL